MKLYKINKWLNIKYNYGSQPYIKITDTVGNDLFTKQNLAEYYLKLIMYDLFDKSTEYDPNILEVQDFLDKTDYLDRSPINYILKNTLIIDSSELSKCNYNINYKIHNVTTRHRYREIYTLCGHLYNSKQLNLQMFYEQKIEAIDEKLQTP